ncbi:hypothetical protein [Tropicibacter sp. Alg240-R139]|uniref:hypothetical protein n=1 Tax=Tropicibacter sp. Alg240-R139 TaxID=2305991 RepID=UPI0013DFD992|nr:hypothetical protein [Tropicibacter sp. Alg240-R139]
MHDTSRRVIWCYSEENVEFAACSSIALLRFGFRRVQAKFATRGVAGDQHVVAIALIALSP